MSSFAKIIIDNLATKKCKSGHCYSFFLSRASSLKEAVTFCRNNFSGGRLLSAASQDAIETLHNMYNKKKIKTNMWIAGTSLMWTWINSGK